MRKIVMLMMVVIMAVGCAVAEESLISTGDYNADVIALHEKLSELGYFTLREESPWSAKSEIALKILQENMDWDITGVVGSEDELERILAVENVVGKNLLLGTNQGITNYRLLDKGFDAVLEDDDIGVRITNKTRDDDGWLVLFFDDGRSRELLSGPEGEAFTLSYEAKSNIDNAEIIIYHRQSNSKGNQITFGTVKLDSSDVWQKIILHGVLTGVEATSQGLYFNIKNNPANTEICIRNVKLEKGVNATEWTPAPEDME